MRSFWSCFTDTLSAEPHPEYGDVLGTQYEYDSHVPNHRAVAPGDVVVLRNSIAVLGHGIVERITERPKPKLMERCPRCGRRAGAPRTVRVPAFRCASCGAEFDVPDEETVATTAFVAHYGQTWFPLDPVIPRGALNRAYAGRDQQNAIRRLDPARTLELLGSASDLESYLHLRLLLGGADIPGGRVDIVARARIGQREFRRLLLDRFGPVCAVTGPQPEAVLDAAHLYSFADREAHRADGGLLLRSDIHRMFDRMILAFDPDSWRTCVAPGVLRRHDSMISLHDRPMQVAPGVRPDRRLLDDHYRAAQTLWAADRVETGAQRPG